MAELHFVESTKALFDSLKGKETDRLSDSFRDVQRFFGGCLWQDDDKLFSSPATCGIHVANGGVKQTSKLT